MCTCSQQMIEESGTACVRLQRGWLWMCSFSKRCYIHDTHESSDVWMSSPFQLLCRSAITHILTFPFRKNHWASGLTHPWSLSGSLGHNCWWTQIKQSSNQSTEEYNKISHTAGRATIRLELSSIAPPHLSLQSKPQGGQGGEKYWGSGDHSSSCQNGSVIRWWSQTR